MTEWPNHGEAWREWRDAMGGHRMHHAWILAGKPGLGKRDFAAAAARELVAEPGIPQPEGDHPDILTLTYLPKDDKEEKKRAEGKSYEVKRNISVSQIRAMQHRLTTRPTLGSRRVIIVDPADDMERNASNALLKSLEEPPRGTYFLLVTHRPARLLPTIRSRCRMLRFPMLPAAQIETMLAREMPDADQAAREAAIAAAGGSLGAARTYIEQDLGPMAGLMRRILTEGDPQLALRGELSQAMGNRPDRARIQAMLELARSTVAQQARVANAANRMALVDTHAALVELAAQAPTYNFDPGLLVMETGGLLARAAEASERANV